MSWKKEKKLFVYVHLICVFLSLETNKKILSKIKKKKCQRILKYLLSTLASVPSHFDSLCFFKQRFGVAAVRNLYLLAGCHRSVTFSYV